MKKVFLMLFAGLVFGIVGCSSTPTNDATNVEATEATTEATTEEHAHEATSEEGAAAIEGKDHVCNEKCTEGHCHFVCGEKGHECTAECKM